MARPRAIVPVSADDNFINFMLYGEPGVGKSVFAGTSPKCLVLANDSGETTPMAIHGSKADRWSCQDYQDLTEAYDYLRHGGCRDYEWVWLDNGTLMQEQGMDMIMAEVHAAKSHRSLYVPDKPEYLQNQNRMGPLIRNIKALPIHVGITAHVMNVEDSSGNLTKQPMFQGGQGAFSQKLCGYMGVVGFMSVAARKDGSDIRKIILTKRARIYAKNRFHVIGKEWVVKTNKAGLIDPSSGIPGMMDIIKTVLPNLGKADAPVVDLATRRKAIAAKKVAAKKVSTPVKKAGAKVQRPVARKAAN